MRGLAPNLLLLALGSALACGDPGETTDEGSTSIATVALTVTATDDTGPATDDTAPPTTTTAGTSATSATSASADATSDSPESSDSEPHDECAFSESFDLPDGSPWPSHWTDVGGVALADVQGGRGRLLPTPGPYAVARMVTALDCTDVEVTFSFEFAGEGTSGVGMYVRQNGGYLQQTMPQGQGYSMFVEDFRQPEGIGVWREVNGVEQMLEPSVPVSVEPNVRYLARVRVTQLDGGTTSLQASFWPASGSEPDGWQVERTDSTASLQGAGGNLAVDTYTSMMSGTAPDMFVDDIIVAAA